MKFIKPTFLFVKAIILSLFICFSGFISAAGNNELKQAYNVFSQHIKSGDFEQSLPYGQKVYKLTKELFPDTHPSRIAAAENLGFTLKQLGHYAEAELVLLDLLQLKENKFGLYAKELLPVIDDLSAVVTSNQQKVYRARYEKLYLRHHSSEFISQLTSTALKVDPFTNEVKERLTDRIEADINVHETQHWTLLMVGSSNQFAEETGEMLEKIYRSMLSFRIALDIPPPKLEHKMLAVYFETLTQRREFNTQKLKTHKSDLVDIKPKYSNRQVFVSQTKSITMRKWNPSAYLALHLSANGNALAKWQVINNSTKYINWHNGLARNTLGKSPWLYPGLYKSFFHSDSNREFGPHTKNYALGSIKDMNKIINKHSAPSVRTIVAPTSAWRQEGKRTTQFDPILIRYLFNYYPDQLAQFFIDASSKNTNGTNPKFRAIFEKAFGDIEQHEKPFSDFLQEFIKNANDHFNLK